MAPILIDSRGLIKLGFVAVFVTASVFAGGFFTGYQKAAGFYQLDIPAQALSLPERSSTQISDIEARVPEVIAAGETIDVDQVDDNQAEVNHAVADAEIIEPSSPSSKMPPSALRPALDSTTGEPVAKHTAAEPPESGSSVATVENTEQAETIEHPDADFSRLNAAKAKFTAQVGTFGQLPNAEKMMGKLQAKGLDAYITTYTTKNNKTRYNVRFGYFSDKKTARKLLRQYKTSQQGDGYLVKFSASNIVNVAEVRDSSSNKSDEDKPAAPSVLLPDKTVGKITQLDISDASARSADSTTAGSSLN
jgi:cell division septation protein DedD